MSWFAFKWAFEFRDKEGRKWQRHPKMKLKREAYLGKEWCPMSLGTMKKGWYSPKSQFCVVSIVRKWRRREWIRIMKKWVFREASSLA